MLTEQKSEPWMQVFWACVGICAGAAQGTVMALVILIFGKSAVTLGDLIPAFTLVGAVPLGVAALLEARARERRIQKMQERIRARHKVATPSNLLLDHDPGPKPDTAGRPDGH